MTPRRKGLFGVSLLVVACGGRTDLHGGLGDPLLLDCPSSPLDPRLATMQVGESTEFDASSFVEGKPEHVRWSIVPTDCDGVSSIPSYLLEDPTQSIASFTPGRPFPYRLRLEVGSNTDTQSCEFDVNVEGPGLRIESCWTDDQLVDLDLFLHTPRNQEPFLAYETYENEWGREVSGMRPTADTCNVLNCTPVLRDGMPRVDFGYADSQLDSCESGPSPARFTERSICPNPRLSVDNNSQVGTETGTIGVAERLHIDRPADGDTFRVMVRNFNNEPTVPFVFVYCSGVRTALLPPEQPSGFVGETLAHNEAPGVMWRPVDITTRVDSSGNLTCEVEALTHPSDSDAAYVTLDDPNY